MKIVTALIVLGLATTLGAVLLLKASPVVEIVNASDSPVTVRLETDIGESYKTGSISPGASVRIPISGRDKAICAVAEFTDGRVLKSQQIYATTQGMLSVPRWH